MSLPDGFVAVITGASSGIGRAIALDLARCGGALTVQGRDAHRLEALAVEARAAGAARVLPVRVELSEDADLQALCQQLAALERIDLLVHSAGVAFLASVEDTPIQQLDLQYQVNLRAPFALTKAAVPGLIAARGQVIFINSGAGLRANPNWSGYATSKFGLKALADAFRGEMEPHGVRVLSAYPGRTATPMQASVRAWEGKAYNSDDFIQPEDVAQTLVQAAQLPRTASVIDLNIRVGPKALHE
jgi:NADP-dependent 3-hydroxy acid dehydrogenase YdfG